MSDDRPAERNAPAPPDDLQYALGSTGVREVDPDAGTARLHYRVRPEFCHTGGIAQGGFVTGWMDAAMAYAVMGRLGEDAKTIWLASLELKVSFLSAARQDTEVVAHGRIVKQGRSVVFLEAQLFGPDERLLATSSSTAKLVRLR